MALQLTGRAVIVLPVAPVGATIRVVPPAVKGTAGCVIAARPAAERQGRWADDERRCGPLDNSTARTWCSGPGLTRRRSFGCRSPMARAFQSTAWRCVAPAGQARSIASRAASPGTSKTIRPGPRSKQPFVAPRRSTTSTQSIGRRGDCSLTPALPNTVLQLTSPRGDRLAVRGGRRDHRAGPPAVKGTAGSVSEARPRS